MTPRRRRRQLRQPARRLVHLGISSALVALVLGVLAPVPQAAAERNESATAPVAAASVTAGDNFTCAVLPGGAVRCWGEASGGRLGLATTGDVGDDEPVTAAATVPLGGPAVAVSAGVGHACALLATGAVRCWGEHTNGKLGHGSTEPIGDDEPASASALVQLGGRATAIAAGSFHTCALLVDGTVRCWGTGSVGRLGYGDEEHVGDDETPAAAGAVDIGGKAVMITAGNAQSCALLEGGTVRCWGANEYGQLGLGHTTRIGDDEDPSDAPTVSLGLPATAITGGSAHTCALLADRSVRCWGDGQLGRLGYGNETTIGNNEVPSAVGTVAIGGPAVGISAGNSHTCAALANGSVRCWGYGFTGRLGLGNEEDVGDDETPDEVAPVALGAPALVVSTGQSHTCAVLTSGHLRCWGAASSGQLGLGNEERIGDDDLPITFGVVPIGRLRIAPEPRPSAISVKAKPKRDRTAPYRWRLRGRVTSTPAPTPAQCTGKVTVTVKKGRKKVARKGVRLSSTCRFKAVVKVRANRVGSRPARLKVKATYGGNDVLRPATRTLRIRAN